MDVKISIIIPVYNVATYLDACLSSCINQTFRDIEIIVVNDGSPDTSYQIIGAYAAMDERIMVVNKENEGLIYARKSGLDIARGEYVFHLDGDDYIERTAMEELYKEAVEKASDYVIGGNYHIFSNNTKKENHIEKEVIGLSGQDLLAFLLPRSWFAIWGRLIRKELFDGIVYRNIFMGEDLFLNMQIVLNVKNAAVVDACLYNYVRHEGAVTIRKNEETLRLNLEMIEFIWFLLDIYPYEKRIKEGVYNHFIGFFIISVKNDTREVRGMLRKYYWDKNESRTYLWKERKKFYFLCVGYLYAPWITNFGVKLIYKLKIFFGGAEMNI